jgi:SAM-dependent methyltransferase
MSWNPDTPFPEPAALGETDSGARNLPAFLCSLLQPGPVVVLGSSEIAIVAASRDETTVIDWNYRRLSKLSEFACEKGVEVRTLCRDPEREELGIAPRSIANVICSDVLEHFRDDVGVLEKLHRILRVDGRLIVRVRAYPISEGERAESPHGPRLYDAEGLRAALEEASFCTLRLRHWNFLGVPSSLLRDRRPTATRCDVAGVPSSERPHRFWDTVLDFWFCHVENRMGFPVGVSLIAVATPHLEKARVHRDGFERGFARRGARQAYEPMATSR